MQSLLYRYINEFNLQKPGLMKHFLIVVLISCLIVDINFIKERPINLIVNEVSPRTFIATQDLNYKNEQEINNRTKEAENNKQLFYKYVPNSENMTHEEIVKFNKFVLDVTQIKNTVKADSLYSSLKSYSNKQEVDYNLLIAINNSSESLSYQNITLYESKLVQFITEGDGVTSTKLDEKKNEIKIYTQNYFKNQVIQYYFFDNIINKLQPSKVVDEEKTNDAMNVKMLEIQQKNAEKIKKGQRIVDQGEIITQQDIDIINFIGLNTAGSNLLKYIKLNCIMFLLLVGLFILTANLESIRNKPHRITLISLFFVSGIIFIVIASLLNIQHSFHLTLIPLIIILIDIFLSKRVAVYTNIIYSIIIGFLSNNMNLTLIYLLIGLTIVLLLSKIKNRSDLTKVSLFTAIITVPLIYCVDTANTYDINDYLLIILNVIISFFMTTHVFTFIERRFNILTPFTLMELQQHKILEELTIKAPGTMTHSINISNLAKNAALSIGIDANLLTIGALYHDIGKLYAPEMFTENHAHFNLKVNPHESLNAYDSALIIKKHVEYGLELAEKLKLPEEIKRLIATHHGHSTIQYFYNKAIELSKSKNRKIPSVNEYKYHWGKPKTKEEGILMLCDIAEAVSKSFDDTSREYIEKKIPTYINKVIDDGELDECELTINDLKKIEKSIIDTLVNLNLKRTKYQNQKD